MEQAYDMRPCAPQRSPKDPEQPTGQLELRLPPPPHGGTFTATFCLTCNAGGSCSSGMLCSFLIEALPFLNVVHRW